MKESDGTPEVRSDFAMRINEMDIRGLSELSSRGLKKFVFLPPNHESYFSKRHGGQSFSRLNERGGLGLHEIIVVLNDFNTEFAQQDLDGKIKMLVERGYLVRE